MAGETEAEAVQTFLDPLQQSISCVSSTVLNVRGGYFASNKPHVLTIGSGAPVRLSSEMGVALGGTILYRVVEAPGDHGPWKVSTAGYLYALEDLHRREYIGYHWHPESRSDETTPHLHVGPAICQEKHLLDKQHVPTGRISLEEVLRFAITALDVKPLRPDWADILGHNQRAFERWRTWHGSGPVIESD